MSNRLIVESKNDKFFIHALVNHLNTKRNSVDIARIYISENDYLPLNGSDSKLIRKGLQKIKDEAQKNPINKIGIVLDMDDKQPLEWFEIINDIIRDVFSETSQNKIEKASSFITITSDVSLDIQIACYFTNVNGRGELEDLLKTIKFHPSPYADCLEAWQSCVEKCTHKSISSKEINKLWVEVFIKYDISTTEEQHNAGKYCNFEYVMRNKLHIWDFEHPALDELKVFLKMFD